jgi:hypothetical protein
MPAISTSLMHVPKGQHVVPKTKRLHQHAHRSTPAVTADPQHITTVDRHTQAASWQLPYYKNTANMVKLPIQALQVTSSHASKALHTSQVVLYKVY